MLYRAACLGVCMLYGERGCLSALGAASLGFLFVQLHDATLYLHTRSLRSPSLNRQLRERYKDISTSLHSVHQLPDHY